MAENLDKYPIEKHVKRRQREKKGRLIGAELLNGDKVFGDIEETRPNVFIVKDKEGQLREVHRTLIKRFMFIIDGGANGEQRKQNDGESGR